MKKSIKVDQKKKRGRPATGRDPMVSSRIPEDVVSAIDQWAERNETTRSDAIRHLVELGLTVKTKAKQPSATRADRAKELAAKTIEKIIDPSAPPEERTQRKHRLIKGPSEFREDRVDLPKPKR
jgi:Arc/MetJ-type ribon-helix-helix transcriptional regulator